MGAGGIPTRFKEEARIMAGNEAESKFFEAMNESSDALIDAVRAGNDRSHRFSTALIEQMQEGQRESVELAKKWMAAPFDVLGFYGAIVESATKAQGRALDVTRQWFGELADAQKETREAFQRIVNANRSASAASVDLARGAVSRATDAVQQRTSGDSPENGGSEDGNGRRTTRSAKTSSARSSA